MRRALILATLAATFAVLPAAPAFAGYEQVGTFGGNAGEKHPLSSEDWPEELRLGGVGGMAVNYTGAGGVAPGTVYAATHTNSGTWVSMFVPKPDGGLGFSLAWRITELPGAVPRCGPALGTQCEPQVGGGNAGNVDVDVNPTNGYVYTYRGAYEEADPFKSLKIAIYTPSGASEIARFGQKAPPSSPVSENPSMIHSVSYGGMAVDASGTVYLLDYEQVNLFYGRVMIFKPQAPGDYEHYSYSGEVSIPDGEFPAVDAAGNLYTMDLTGKLKMYAPPTPAAYPAPTTAPICQFTFKKGVVRSFAVNPQTGEPFFFSESDKQIHRLTACQGGVFAESGNLGVVPARTALYALAVDPTRVFSEGRPPGLLYAAAAGGAGGEVDTSTTPFGYERALGYIFSQPAEIPPLVEAQSVGQVHSTGAELRARINPKGSLTSYTFQYLTEAAFEANPPGERFAGASEAPLGGAPLGEGSKSINAAVAITGLQPDTGYRYRVLATSHCSVPEPEKLCQGFGSDRGFRTFPSESRELRDHRAYELVSPPQKLGGQVFPADPSLSGCGPEAQCKPGEGGLRFPMQSRPDGNAVAYEGASFSPDRGASDENQYVAYRDPDAGWQSVNPTPAELQGSGYRAIDSALKSSVLAQSGPQLSPQAPAGYPNLYLQATDNPLAIEPMLSTPPPNRSATASDGLQLRYAGASSDLSRVFFEANDVLTAAVPSIAPEPEDGGPDKFNLYEWEAASGQLRLVNVLPGNAATEAGVRIGAPSTNAVSADGSRVFFSDQVGQVYVREGASATREIPDAGEFLSASRDGSRVLLGNGHLYDLETGLTVDLTEDNDPTAFEGVSGQSDDLSRIYFVDTEVLTGDEPNGAGAKAIAGKPNLYAWSNEGSTRFVATLVPGVLGDEPGFLGSGVTPNSWSPNPSTRTAEASQNGRYLTFVSKGVLTGHDNTGPCSTNGLGAYVQAPCPEVYLYDSNSAELVCASCSPAGTAPLGHSTLRRFKNGADFPQSRYLTDSGRLFFDSRDSLSPFDNNDGFEDVYQYEFQGSGTCARAPGCLSLISPGTAATDSNLLAVDEDGENVFFTTRDRLVRRDRDELVDLYDARENGGIEIDDEPPAPSCQGEGCLPPPGQPSSLLPASVGLEGAGNPPSHQHCKRGKLGRNGKCVRKRKHKGKHNRRHQGQGHKRGGTK